MGECISIPISDAVAAYIADLELQGRSGSARSYRHALGAVSRLDIPSLGHLTGAVCRSLLAEQARTVKGSTLLTYYAVLRSFCRWAVDQGYLASNPTDAIPKPRQVRPAHRWLTVAQLGEMYRGCANDIERLIMLLCGGSGLRAQEFLTLRWRDVDFDHETIRVLGKGKKWRTLSPGAMAFDNLMQLAKLSEVAQIGDLVKLSQPGYVCPFRTNDNLIYHVRQLAKRAGIPYCTTHMLRHSFAVAWLESTDDAFTLQTLLGHSSPIMTGYYVRDVREAAGSRKQRAVDLGSAIFGEDAG